MRRIGWLKAMLRDEANHAQALAAVFGRFLGRDVLEKDGDLCEVNISPSVSVLVVGLG